MSDVDIWSTSGCDNAVDRLGILLSRVNSASEIQGGAKRRGQKGPQATATTQ